MIANLPCAGGCLPRWPPTTRQHPHHPLPSTNARQTNRRLASRPAIAIARLQRPPAIVVRGRLAQHGETRAERGHQTRGDASLRLHQSQATSEAAPDRQATRAASNQPAIPTSDAKIQTKASIEQNGPGVRVEQMGGMNLPSAFFAVRKQHTKQVTPVEGEWGVSHVETFLAGGTL